jgi:hypothetical protein
MQLADGALNMASASHCHLISRQLNFYFLGKFRIKILAKKKREKWCCYLGTNMTDICACVVRDFPPRNRIGD